MQQMTTVPVFDDADVQKNKTMAALSYIIFFLPLLACPDSRFARFHANQALLNTILCVVLGILTLIPFIGFIFWIASAVVGVFSILGLVNACRGEAKFMPLYGHMFQLIKTDK